MLEAGYQIVGVSHDDHVAPGLVPPPALGPEIETVMQVDIGEERRDHRALTRSPVIHCYDPVFEYTRPQPFLDQVDDALIADPMFKVAHQPVSANRPKRRDDRLPIAGIFPIR